MKSPLNWYGGKYYMSQKLKGLIENIDHKIYVEVFGGAGHLIFAKTPSEIDVYNDIHSGLVNFMQVLRTNPDELQLALTLTPYSREEWESCRDNWMLVDEPIEKARQFYVAYLQSFSSIGGSWSYSRGVSRRGMSQCVSQWLNAIDSKITNCVHRIRELQIDNLSFEELILKYDSPDTLFYLDPPYLPETRISEKVYDHEMTYQDHEKLVDLLLELKGKAVLSNYDNDLYNKLGWQKLELGKFALQGSGTASGNARKKKVEMVWVKK